MLKRITNSVNVKNKDNLHYLEMYFVQNAILHLANFKLFNKLKTFSGKWKFYNRISKFISHLFSHVIKYNNKKC